jgi:regulator of protease activity HflC (stomatin/prohibitin superfamily)
MGAMTISNKKVKRLTLLAIGVPAALLAFNGAMHLLSTPSDSAVFAGYLILLALGTVALSMFLSGCRAFGKSEAGKRFLEHLTGAGPLVLALVCVCGLSSCYRMVEPGHVGLLVKQTGSDRGVQDYPIQTGRVFYDPVNEDVLLWPTNVQRVIWTAATGEGHPSNEEIAFQSKEGLHFTADVNAAYQMQRDKVPHFYVQFRTEDLAGFTHGFFRDAVRNAFNLSTSYTAEEINGAGQSELIVKVQDAVKKKMETYGVDVIQIGFAAPPRPPDQVQNAIHSKIAAIQKSEQTEFEKRAAIAEGEKVKALAPAYAESNKVTNLSLTPQLIEWEKIKKWDGHNSQVVTGSGSTLVNVK